MNNNYYHKSKWITYILNMYKNISLFWYITCPSTSEMTALGSCVVKNVWGRERNQQVMYVAGTRTVFELQLQYIRGVWRIFRVLGHQVQVSWSMALKEKHRHSLSLFQTLDSLWWITGDLLRPHQRAALRMWRLLCEVITDNGRHGGEKKREDDAWKTRNLKMPHEMCEDKKKRKEKKEKSMFHFSPLFGFIFPYVALHHRGR